MAVRPQRWRLISIFVLFALLVAVLVYRLVDLGIVQRSFLLKQSQARVLRTVIMPAHRGMIQDRHGQPLAISTSVVSIWVNPQQFDPTSAQLAQLAKILQLPQSFIQKRAKPRGDVEFAYLKRRVSPELAEKIKALNIVGVHQQKEYKRFYPESMVSSHVVGFTNIDDQGQEGVELAYNNWLAGSPGKKRVLKDRLGHVIANVSLLNSPEQGKNLTLSIDQRLQFLAYNVLSETVKKYQAKAGTIVVLDPKSGEVLAMVNQPTYNPNSRPKDTDGRYRNRAVTDIFEPGSTIKPFNVAYALQSGKYDLTSQIDTNPGWMQIGGYTIRDDGLNYGVINLTELLKKSSNIGAAKVMLSLPPVGYWYLLRQMGFGERTRSGFPGEASGTLIDRDVWRPSVIAGLAYGYGMAVTALQLAQAYAVIADDGVKVPVTFLKHNNAKQGKQVIPASIANTITNMLQQVVEDGGTGRRAKVYGYHVAGKTGTAYISDGSGYNKKKYVSSFVGFAPTTNPKLVVAVVVFEPHGQHFGAVVAAPAFAKVMAGGLRLLSVSPDNLSA